MTNLSFITLNGQKHPLSTPCTIRELLNTLQIKGPVVVEHNGTALLPQQFDKITIHPGDQLELVAIVAGG